MSLAKVSPKQSPKERQKEMKGYDFPLRASLIVESPYHNDVSLAALESERTVTSQCEHHLCMDGLCQNTLENLDNSAVDEEKTERKQCPVWSCSTLLMFLVCALSLISLVLTLLMLTGNISSRCGCTSTKDLNHSKSKESSGFSFARGKLETENGFQRWVMDALRNITEKMDGHSRDFHKLKDDFTLMKENKEKKDKEFQESLKEARNELDSRITVMDEKMTRIDLSLRTLNTTSDEIQKATDKLRQDIVDTRKLIRLKTFGVLVLHRNLTTLLNQSNQECRTNYSSIQTKLQKLYLTKDEINSSLQEISSDLLRMKTYIAKQINTTKRTLQNSSSMLQDSISSLNETLLNKINASSLVPGTELPDVNAANFSQCQYKVMASPGTTITGNRNNIVVDAELLEPKGKRIVGSTCSTNGAAEYNFIQLNVNGTKIYRCKCKGASTLFTLDPNDKIRCYLHYWECPFVD